MKFCFFISLLKILTSYFNFSTVQGIIGGHPATEVYPFFVLIPKGAHRCGGTVVAPDLVLTAAQCLFHEWKDQWADPQDLYILHGNFSVPDKWFAKYYGVESYGVHKMYHPRALRGTSTYDVALIKLDDHVFKDRVNYAGRKTMLGTCHWKFRIERFRVGVAIGLGLINENPAVKAVQLMEITLRKNDTCAWTDLKVQVCYSNRISDPIGGISEGDTGGPLIYMKDGEPECIIGISSYNLKRFQHEWYQIFNIFTIAGVFHRWMTETAEMLSGYEVIKSNIR